jgi:hypothetical protein
MFLHPSAQIGDGGLIAVGDPGLGRSIVEECFYLHSMLIPTFRSLKTHFWVLINALYARFASVSPDLEVLEKERMIYFLAFPFEFCDWLS